MDGWLFGSWPETSLEEIGRISSGKSASGHQFLRLLLARARGRIQLQADVIVNRIAKTLLAAQVSLRRLN